MPIFSAKESLLIRLTDAMTRDINVPGALMDELQQSFSPQETVDIVGTVAAYNMVSRFLVALNIVH